MPKKANTNIQGNKGNKSAETLAAALANKGTPGVILLGFIIATIWAFPTAFLFRAFYSVPDLSKDLKDTTLLNSYLVILIIGLIVVIIIAFLLTRTVLEAMIPTIRADAEAATLMAQAFGGRVTTSSGGFAIKPLDQNTAKRRIKKILETLTARAAQVLELSESSLVRANIFVNRKDQWLTIADGMHVNMKNKEELTIEILKGHLSSGTAFNFFIPILSIAHETPSGLKWDHLPDDSTLEEEGAGESLITKMRDQVGKVEKDLRWILSMPIPYQVLPFEMACGILNVDGLTKIPFRDQLKQLLADAAVAAALVGIINKTTDVLGGQCQRRIDIPSKLQDASLKTQFMIMPEEFDPADCPEPTEDFKRALSKIKGLEFFGTISTTSVAEFIKEQLRC